MLTSNRTGVTTTIAILLVGIGGLFMLNRALAPAAAPADAPAALVEFNPDGNLKRPTVSYRQWVFIGEPLTPNDLNNGAANFPEFHTVYMDPESFAHYQKTGEVRDGCVLVKELSSVGAKTAASGNGYFMGDLTGLDVAIKDSKRFKNEPGYWAYFSFGHKYPLKDEATKNSVNACNKCHQDNAKTDWVFSQYYPVLRAAHSR